jgi:ankyrin repeat protein
MVEEEAAIEIDIFLASRSNPQSSFVRELISAGADVNAVDAQGLTPLHIASYYGQEEICSALCSAPGINLEARNRHGETALHLAAKWPHDKAADALVKGGADPNASNKRGRTPLHTAALFARRTVLEKLIAAGKLCEGMVHRMEHGAWRMALMAQNAICRRKRECCG